MSSQADIAAFTAVTGGLISNPPNVNSALTIEHSVCPYLKYEVDSFFSYQTGIFLIPVAEEQSNTNGTPTSLGNRVTSEIVQSSAPFGYKVVIIHAQRVNAKPLLPEPVSSDPNEVLASVVIRQANPVIMPDMVSRIFTATAEYIYLLKEPIWLPTDNKKYPISQADGYPRTQYTMTANQFVKGLI